jgi:hypothetical protein
MAFDRKAYERSEKSLAKGRAYRAGLKKQVYEHYCGGTPMCMCCGETIQQFLSLDHINNDGAAHRKQFPAGQVYLDIIRRGFPPAYDILCMNCNWGRRMNKGVCPHGTARWRTVEQVGEVQQVLAN